MNSSSDLRKALILLSGLIFSVVLRSEYLDNNLFFSISRLSTVLKLLILAYSLHSVWLIYRELVTVLDFRLKSSKLEKEKAFFTNTFALVSHHLKSPLSSSLLAATSIRFSKDKDSNSYRISDAQYQLLVNSLESSLNLTEYLVANQKQINKLVEKESLLLADVVNDIVEQKELAKPVFDKNSHSQVLLPSEAFVIRMALETFVQNSIEHAGMKPVIRVNEDYSVFVRDYGKGIPASMFDKFGKSMQPNGAVKGIGVYHTKKLLHAVGWDFKLLPENGFHVKIYRMQDESANQNEFQQVSYSSPLSFLSYLRTIS